MIHYMKLKDEPFCAIKSGKKVVEMRLFDEKRKLLKLNDFIKFVNIESEEKLDSKVQELKKFSNFEELYNFYDKTELGYMDYQNASYKDMLKYYSNSDIEKYGVIAIKIKVVD